MKNREMIIEKNTYVILRELHKWEKDPAAKTATEALVQVLISDKPEKGMEDFNEVQIPEKVRQSF